MYSPETDEECEVIDRLIDDRYHVEINANNGKFKFGFYVGGEFQARRDRIDRGELLVFPKEMAKQITHSGVNYLVCENDAKKLCAELWNEHDVYVTYIDIEPNSYSGDRNREAIRAYINQIVDEIETQCLAVRIF